MSDVMPYRSTVFSTMDAARRRDYRDAWRKHLAAVLDAYEPDLIHAHHAWIMTAQLKALRPDTPVVVHTHGTALRQRMLCPDVPAEIDGGLRRVDRLLALHDKHAHAYGEALGLPPERIRVIGAGYRDDVFHTRARAAEPGALLYAGKLSASKGLPELLDALAILRRDDHGVVLHVAGGGAGDEAEAIRARCEATDGVVLHGRLDQGALADLARRCAVFVLPSFYEGLPLVLVEALACGCRLVSTALPGVVGGLAELGPALELVAAPRMATVDVPVEEDRPAFVRELAGAIRRSLDAPPADPALATAFTWGAVFERIEAEWRGLLGEAPG
jgi:glycosyltransferase involved in cell wall biosynthesis